MNNVIEKEQSIPTGRKKKKKKNVTMFVFFMSRLKIDDVTETSNFSQSTENYHHRLADTTVACNFSHSSGNGQNALYRRNS